MKLNDLKIGEECVITKINASSNIKRRLMDIGFNRGTKVSLVFKNASMRAYKIKGTLIGLRNDDTKDIEVMI